MCSTLLRIQIPKKWFSKECHGRTNFGFPKESVSGTVHKKKFPVWRTFKRLFNEPCSIINNCCAMEMFNGTIDVNKELLFLRVQETVFLIRPFSIWSSSPLIRQIGSLQNTDRPFMCVIKKWYWSSMPITKNQYKHLKTHSNYICFFYVYMWTISKCKLHFNAKCKQGHGGQLNILTAECHNCPIGIFIFREQCNDKKYLLISVTTWLFIKIVSCIFLC